MVRVKPIWNKELQDRFKYSSQEIAEATECLYGFYRNTYK